MMRSLNNITWGDEDLLVVLVKGTGGRHTLLAAGLTCRGTGLLDKTEAELRVQQFVKAVDAVDDEWTLSLPLDLKLLELKEGELAGVRAMCRLDVVTKTPVPGNLVRAQGAARDAHSRMRHPAFLQASPDAEPIPAVDPSSFQAPEVQRVMRDALLAVPDLDPEHNLELALQTARAELATVEGAPGGAFDLQLKDELLRTAGELYSLMRADEAKVRGSRRPANPACRRSSPAT